MGNQLKTAILLGTLSGLLIAISYWVIGGTGGLIIGIGLAAATNLFSWYQSDKIALAVYNAQPVTAAEAPALYRIVQKLSSRANIPMPGVYIVPSPTANAFATGRDPEHAAVAVTAGILDILPEDELEGVIAHELTHIINRDTLTQAVAATVAGAVSFLAQMLSYSLWFGGGSRDNERGGNPLGVLATVIFAPMAATIIQLAISRTREFSADAGAAKLTGNPRALARALQRLESTARQMPLNANPAFEPLLIIHPISGQFLGNLFSSHPATEARVEALLQLERQLISR
ncbi:MULTISPECIES: M48 family metalloprotease [Nostocales]|jgi:heat shock protein HtpX|uniref:Protease HtpX homolog n=3 Tax=Dolichospermum TaxID=748770 RepID=A0A6H2C2I0_DOLFA|nr:MULTISPECIES: M48 family metalloprotease [Nostocales]MBJ7297916.1 M48 family metalloprotease [Dolichospermum sp.]MBO1050987.1 M48 family metalloprotease [Dolichospermum sp. DET73]MBO1057752.1 M48 family metalloprotease [Dolichospermum sp. JUN01]MBS9387632.1 M48 family metalloprotease [Dolichospermum sp. WA123]MBS9395203.1 M48 family metalloprotease [Dolichospermum sp. OL01]MCO5798830.1 M48 family metalloprotease [Dolichospermum sp. OL03]OBQ33659.1 MAG: protease HtpX [Anabaena sp. MDT14b]